MGEFLKVASYVVYGVFGLIFFSYGMSLAIHEVMDFTMTVSWAIVFMAWLVITGILTIYWVER